jgi:hypothetical protein
MNDGPIVCMKYVDGAPCIWVGEAVEEMKAHEAATAHDAGRTDKGEADALRRYQEWRFGKRSQGGVGA